MELGELWIDKTDAEAKLSSLKVSPEVVPHFKKFLKDGYTIFPKVVAADVCDQIVKEAQSVAKQPERYIFKRTGKYFDPTGITALDKGDRIIDMYGMSKAARQSIYPPVVAEFLRLIFGEPAVAQQSLYFEYGSQQAIHQDTAYVVSSKPLSLAATWLALEDVVPGSGELLYYPGSHRFNHYLFGGESKSWSQGVHGAETHKRFLAQLHEQAKERGLKMESFLAKKGDILVWHADLAHGGAKITNNNTRRSLVVHFCPQSVKPAYQKLVGEAYFELPDPSGNFFASRHYDLKSVAQGTEGQLYYDAGISRNRKAAAAPATAG